MTIYTIRDYWVSVAPFWVARYDNPALEQPNSSDVLTTVTYNIRGAAVAEDGTLYAIDHAGYVRHLDADGIDLGILITLGGTPTDVIIVNGKLYVSLGTTLQRYALAGDLETSWTLAAAANFISVNSDETILYYATGSDKLIRQHDLAVDITMPEFTTATGFLNVVGLRVLADGGVIASQTQSIARYDPAGVRLGDWHTTQWQEGCLPGHVAGNWYRISLDPDGEHFWTAAQNTGSEWWPPNGTRHSSNNFVQKVPIDSYGTGDLIEPESPHEPSVEWFHANNDDNWIRHSFLTLFEGGVAPPSWVDPGPQAVRMYRYE